MSGAAVPVTVLAGLGSERHSMASERSPTRYGHGPQLMWVDSADYADPPARTVDPAPLARMLAAWSSACHSPDEIAEREREATREVHDGPIHLVRLLAAMERAARHTGGTLIHVTDTPAVTRTCGGSLHHLMEVLHSGGLRAAVTVARGLDDQARFLAITALRPYWQAPVRALCTPLRDSHIQLHERH